MGSRSDLRANLQKGWESMHELYVHEEQPPVKEAPSETTLCSRVGHCVCSGLGLKALCCHRRLVQFLRPLFTPKRKRKKQEGQAKQVELSAAEKAKQELLLTHRKLLTEAFIVLRVAHEGSVEQADGAEAPFQDLGRSWSEMALQALGCTSDPAAQQPLWMHIGHLNLTTWSMAVLPLDLDAEPRHDGLLRLNVKRPYGAADSLTYFTAALDFNLTLNVTAYVIVSDNRVLGLPEMIPDWILVQKLESIPSSRFWDGWQSEEDNRKQRELAKAQKAAGRKRGGRQAAKSEPAPKRRRRPAEDGHAAEYATDNAADLEESVGGAADEGAQDPFFDGFDFAIDDPLDDESRERLERQDDLLRELLGDTSDKHSEGSKEDDLLQELQELEEISAANDGEREACVGQTDSSLQFIVQYRCARTVIECVGKLLNDVCSAQEFLHLSF